MLIRAADAGRDASACAAVYAPYVLESATSFEEQAPTDAEMATRIESVCVTHPWLVAEDAGRVVGFAYAARHRERAAYRWSADVTVYVNREQQRRGVGRALYSALIELLRRQRFQVACAGITLPNDASVALHESLGFKLVGVYRRIGWKEGSWRDVGWWELELVPAEPGVAPPEPGQPARLEDR